MSHRNRIGIDSQLRILPHLTTRLFEYETIADGNRCIDLILITESDLTMFILAGSAFNATMEKGVEH
jgi:hypothetical protein